METYSDNNSAPDVPDDSAGSSVSSRLQDEYEELLKYAVVIPKIDVDDLPRILADSKRALTQHIESEISDDDDDHSNASDSESLEATDLLTSSPKAVAITSRQGIGKIMTPTRRPVETDTPVSNSKKQTVSSYRHQSRFNEAPVEEIRHTSESDSDEDDTNIHLEKTVQSEVERAPSDSDLKDIERKLDLWTRQLNSNIMDEISQLKLKLNESSRHQLHYTQSRHAGEINTMRNELENLKELLNTYETSIERKDGVIANLTRSLQNQKEKLETLRVFTDWKIQFAAAKQEGYGMRLAAQHHRLVVKRRCWKAWHMIIVEKWRRRVEKACQAKAQEVCISVTNDYEARLKSLDEKYMASRDEVLALHREREYYEENMKKAFMRGVCALNMEAMNMFQEPDPSNNPQNSGNPDHGVSQSHDHYMNTRDTENAIPTNMPSAAGLASQQISSPLSRQPYTVPHKPAYTTVTRPEHNRHVKRLATTVTADKDRPKVGKPSTSRMMEGRSILVERHDNSPQPSGDDTERSNEQPQGSTDSLRSSYRNISSGLRTIKIVP